MRQQEQVANHTYVVRRSSANNGLPYRQQQLSEQETDEYEDVWPPRIPNSAIRYTTTVEDPPVIRSDNRRYVIHNSPPPQPQVKAKRTAHPQEEDEPTPRPRRRIHPLVILGCGMALMLGLWILGTIAVNWWQVTQDDWHYGRPRTYQIDAVVGHNNDSSTNPSHFIALNFRSHIQIIELPAGDSAKAKIYSLPLYGQGLDLTVVTLAFKDVNGDGKPDMIISINQVTHIVFINDNGQFRPLKSGEQTTSY
ncbi:MAG TPA: VCBS repeat-containing protein [Ktedonobacteraceae bacterium]